MPDKAILVVDLREGSVIALPFGRTATLLEDPKIGTKFVTISTQYGKARLNRHDYILVETDEDENE